MSEVWDDSSGRWVPEAAPFVAADRVAEEPIAPAPVEPLSDPLYDLITEEERRRGGFYTGRADHLDDGFLARTQVAEDRSDDGFRIKQAAGHAHAAYLAYVDAPDIHDRVDLAYAMSRRLRDLLTVMGVME